MQLKVNDVLGGNQIKKIIGDPGAYGIAYEVENANHTTPIVLKLFNKDGDIDAEKRFFQENEILRCLNPHIRIITSLSDTSKEGSYIYYLMELADYSLHKYRLQKQKVDLSEVKNFMIGICEGLEYAHAKGYTHRDLYWNNVLLKNISNINEVKLADFGLAKDFNVQNFSSTPNQIWGCPFIRPPEYRFAVWDSEPKLEDYKCGDIYALGILLFFLFDGYPMLHEYRIAGEISTLLANKNIVTNSSQQEKELAYQEWLQTLGNDFFKNLEISDPDIDIMNKVNNLIHSVSNPNRTKRETSLKKVISDINLL